MKKGKQDKEIRDRLDSASGDEWLRELDRIEQERKNRKQKKRMQVIKAIGFVLVLVAAGAGAWFAAPAILSRTGTDKASSNGSKNLAVEETENETAAEDASAENGTDVRLIMVGDVVLHESIENLAEQENGGYDYSCLFENMKSTIESADLALVNQEVILGGEELGISGYPKFNAAYEMADNLVDAGFDVVLEATNHAGDKGEKGILNCLNNWKTKYPDFPVLGIHDSEEAAEEICVVEEKGIKIAVLNYTQSLNHSVSKKYMISRMDEEKVRSDIQKAKTMADFVVVCPHWGTEYQNKTDSTQEKWAKIFLEEGVDLVIGTHPHVLEKVETLTDEETGHSMLVYYSLGNYCSWISKTGTKTQKREIGSMADVTIGKLEDGTIGIKSYGIKPLICHIAGDMSSITVYPYEEYSDEMAENHLLTAYGRDFNMEYIDEYCASVWGDDWKSEFLDTEQEVS